MSLYRTLTWKILYKWSPRDLPDSFQLLLKLLWELFLPDSSGRNLKTNKPLLKATTNNIQTESSMKMTDSESVWRHSQCAADNNALTMDQTLGEINGIAIESKGCYKERPNVISFFFYYPEERDKRDGPPVHVELQAYVWWRAYSEPRHVLVSAF